MKPPLASLLALTMACGMKVTPSMEAWSFAPVFYDDQPVPQRGGRWRAIARWRNWWATERRPATRYTSRRAR